MGYTPKRETDNISQTMTEEDTLMKKMLSVLLAAMMLLSLLAVPALAEDQVLTVVTWDATTTAYLTAQKEAKRLKLPIPV